MEVRIAGVKLRVEFSFLVLMAIVFLVRDTDIILNFFLAAFIHELSHGAVLLILGGSIHKLIFSGSGIKMIPKNKYFSTSGELFILIAGPGMNILTFMIFGGSDFGIVNLAAGLFNLLPYSSLDGGSILELLFPMKRRSLCILKFLPVVIFAALTVLYEKNFIIITLASAIYMCSDLRKA